MDTGKKKSKLIINNKRNKGQGTENIIVKVQMEAYTELLKIKVLGRKYCFSSNGYKN